MPVIDYRDLPKVMATSARGIKRAGVNTLNTVAFQTLKPLVAKAEGDIQFSRNARRALGWQVQKADLGTMQAEVFTTRGWFGLHSKEGTRQASSRGMTWRGQSWIFVPRDKGVGVVSKKGMIRKSASAGIYLTPRGDHALVFYRSRKGAKDSEFIGVAVKSAAFHEDTDWRAVIEAEWAKSAHTIMKRNIETRLAFERSR